MKLSIYEYLDLKRQARDWSWRYLAQQVGVSSSTFTRMKSGGGISATTLYKICEVVGWDLWNAARKAR